MHRRRLALEQLESRHLLTEFVESGRPSFQIEDGQDGTIHTVTLNEFGLLTLESEALVDPEEGAETTKVTVILNDGKVVDENGVPKFDASAFNRDAVTVSTNGDVSTTTAELNTNLVLVASQLARLDAEDPGRVRSIGNIELIGKFFDITLSGDQLLRPFATFTAPAESVVGDEVEIQAAFESVSQSPLVDREGSATVRIDFGDGTMVEKTITINDLLEFDLTDSHTYSQPGSYTIIVSGIIPTDDGGSIALRPVQATIVVKQTVTISDTSGDDNISLSNANNELIANVNGTVQVLGNSADIGQVIVQLGRGNNVVDASGLLESQSLFIPAFGSLASDINHITGGPGDDTINGGRSIDNIFGLDGDDFIVPSRGNDRVDGGPGDDIIAIINSFGFGTPFEREDMEFTGGEGYDTFLIEDLEARLSIFSLLNEKLEFDGKLNLRSGTASSSPQVDAFLRQMEEFRIGEQTRGFNVNVSDGMNPDGSVGEILRLFVAEGSPENDRVNLTNATFDSRVNLGDGNDEFLGGDGKDHVEGASGNDTLNGNDGNDTLNGGGGTNTIRTGSGDDVVDIALRVAGSDTIEDPSDFEVDGDFLRLLGVDQDVMVDIDSGALQEIATDRFIDLNLSSGRPIEGVTVEVAEPSNINVSGTTADNKFVLELLVGTEFLAANGIDSQIVLSDGGGGNDTFSSSRNTTLPVTIESTPNSGDLIDLGPFAAVTSAFTNALRAVNVDLDLEDVDQVVDVNGNTIRYDSPIRNFVGSGFDDTLEIDATIRPRSASGGAGTDVVTIDAAGRAVTQSVDGTQTTVEVAGFAPIVVTEFETITIANQGPAGGLGFDMSPGNDEATLQLLRIVSGNFTTFSEFELSETNDAFVAQEFLHEKSVTEIRAVGTDSLTIDVIGQPFEIVGADVLIADLPAIRLVGFTEVTIDNAGIPGDYNNDGRVDLADYTVWRNNLGSFAGTLPNDSDGGVIGTAQYNTWKTNFGRTPGSEVFQLTPSLATLTSGSESAAAYFRIDSTLASFGEPKIGAAISDSPAFYSSNSAVIEDDLLLLLVNPQGEEASTGQGAGSMAAEDEGEESASVESLELALGEWV